MKLKLIMYTILLLLLANFVHGLNYEYNNFTTDPDLHVYGTDENTYFTYNGATTRINFKTYRWSPTKTACFDLNFTIDGEQEWNWTVELQRSGGHGGEYGVLCLTDKNYTSPTRGLGTITKSNGTICRRGNYGGGGSNGGYGNGTSSTFTASQPEGSNYERFEFYHDGNGTLSIKIIDWNDGTEDVSETFTTGEWNGTDYSYICMADSINDSIPNYWHGYVHNMEFYYNPPVTPTLLPSILQFDNNLSINFTSDGGQLCGWNSTEGVDEVVYFEDDAETGSFSDKWFFQYGSNGQYFDGRHANGSYSIAIGGATSITNISDNHTDWTYFRTNYRAEGLLSSGRTNLMELLNSTGTVTYTWGQNTANSHIFVGCVDDTGNMNYNTTGAGLNAWYKFEMRNRTRIGDPGDHISIYWDGVEKIDNCSMHELNNYTATTDVNSFLYFDDVWIGIHAEPAGDDVICGPSTDKTPTFKFTTDNSGVCRLDNRSADYSDMNTSMDCTTSGGTSHTCTYYDDLPLQATNPFYISCCDTTLVNCSNYTLDNATQLNYSLLYVDTNVSYGGTLTNAQFRVNNTSAQDLEPVGQNASVPIYNITNIGNYDATKLSLRLNVSLGDDINIWCSGFSDFTNESNLTTVNYDLAQNFTMNVSAGETQGIWCRIDLFNIVSGRFNDLYFQFDE